MENDKYSRTKEELLALRISKTTHIAEMEEFRYQTSLKEQGFSHSNGSGDRVYGVLDKNGTLYTAWTAGDTLANLPEGISVHRIASTIDDPHGYGSFSMTTRVEIHPNACPVRIYTYKETMVKRGTKSETSISYYSAEVLSAL